MLPIPDPKWADALKLPTKVLAGLFLAAGAFLLLDQYGMLRLADFHAQLRTGVIAAAVVFGCLTLTSLIGEAWGAVKQFRKAGQLEARRSLRQKEAKDRLTEAQVTVLKRLEHLSAEEIHVLAEALRQSAQSFNWPVHDGCISNLGLKGLLDSPGGEHNRYHYPFTIPDFVWAALLGRRDEFLERDITLQRQKAEQSRGGRLR